MADRYPETGMTGRQLGAVWAFVAFAVFACGMAFKAGWALMTALMG